MMPCRMQAQVPTESTPDGSIQRPAAPARPQVILNLDQVRAKECNRARSPVWSRALQQVYRNYSASAATRGPKTTPRGGMHTSLPGQLRSRYPSIDQIRIRRKDLAFRFPVSEARLARVEAPVWLLQQESGWPPKDQPQRADHSTESAAGKPGRGPSYKSRKAPGGRPVAEPCGTSAAARPGKPDEQLAESPCRLLDVARSKLRDERVVPE